MSKARKSLGVMWVGVDPKGNGIASTVAYFRSDCRFNLSVYTGMTTYQLRSRGFRVVKVELTEIS